MNEKILVIAHHPDDEVLGVGGTIMKHIADGDEVFIFILAEGVAARHGGGFIEKIKLHALESAEILGVKSENISFGGYLYNNRFDDSHLTDLIASIEKKIRETNPEIIYVPHYGDSNTDHVFVSRAAMAAVRPIARCNKNIKKVMFYEVFSSTEQAFQTQSTAFFPNVYIDISDFLDRKIKAFSCYVTEMQQPPHPRSSEGLIHLAKMRGFSVRRNAAEAFMLMREVK